MLQQMSSSASVHVGEVASITRLHEGRWGDVSSEASSDAAEDSERPQCKIRRNYNCAKCTFYTQNPRSYLEHTRDAHFVKLKIFDCPYCVYASRHHQKLVRHIKMVHSANNSTANTKLESEQSVTVSSSATLTNDSIPNKERIEDMLEEVEDCEESTMEVDDGPDDVEMVNERNAELVATADPQKAKEKFFSCEKCNYVTHLRARYTKHVKYHSMPMIKCSICEFRTPYKWNLDRHMKHHGGSGSFNCSMCNFTADIKQSLTVHEMNHHTPVAGQSLPSRRRNRVGASDTLAADAAMRTVLLPKEDEGSGDSRSSHSASDMGLHYAERDIVSCKSDSNDGTDGLAKRDVAHLALDANSQHSPNSSTDESKSHKHGRKAPRPIPQLIPLNTSTPNQKQTLPGEPPHKKFKDSTNINIESCTKIDNFPGDITITPVNNPVVKENAVRKKNESFFDRLKERLLTETGEKGSLVCKNCGFESKCLSEHSVHEKNCTPQTNRIIGNTALASLGSTRCQNCRHRCKSSADLYIHMQTCGNSTNFENSLDLKRTPPIEATTSNNDKEIEPHPMENVVFVWNNFQGPNKFDTPLDININNDSTLPEMPIGFDIDITDENESMNLSPSQAVGKKVFKCPHCAFFSRTASRFHVHIVGHLNKKPFECSLCKYKSNWRWDITKHIKLKSARDPDHNEAKVLMTDETGRRNYSKYNKFLATPIQNENGENEFHYIDPNSAADGSMEVDEPYSDMNDVMGVPTPFEMQPLNLQTLHSEEKSFDFAENSNFDVKKPKKTLWKCKKCNYKDPSKEALLEHVRQHSRLDGNPEDPRALNVKKPDNTPDPADLAYRCGHCNQLSNWKHVIQRHCRLKHEGIVKVITTIKPKSDAMANDINNDTCNKCPYKSTDRSLLQAHLQQHKPSPDSVFKCYFCPYFVKDEQDLIQHLLLHGITDPEEYINKASGSKSPTPDQPGSSLGTSNKRHKCTDCPYETNSKSQYMYHEQFHRLPADTPYKCPECNYSVSKRHLLHQHLRVHGITRKMDSEAELEASVSLPNKSDAKSDELTDFEEIPCVWVSAKDIFHKMFKCRYCSYVNSQKCKIPNHEKIHCVVFENEKTIYKCLECYYSFDCATKLTEHSKSHCEIYGRIYCAVDEDIPDEEQIDKLRKVMEADNAELINNEGDCNKEGQISQSREIKTLYFCQKCPARFFDENEVQVHENSHGLALAFKCIICDFSVDDENDLNTHNAVHSDEYHTRSKILKFVHNSHPSYKQPRLEPSNQDATSELTWMLASPNKIDNLENMLKKPENKHAKQYCCKQCPAKFFKSSALCYHLGLHGGEGEHKCKKCNYAVKNIGNLAKHELLHENENKPSGEYESGDDMDYKNIPLSGTDLFQRKTEAQKRVLTDKDKLVKPNDHFPPVLLADPQFGYLMHGNPEFIYPTYMKNGRQKEKRYKCHKCPSAFEKREQYKIHLSLHGSKQRYKCELCDYSVKYYANYVQHMRKHQMNDEAQAERRKGDDNNAAEPDGHENVKKTDTGDNIKLAIKTMPKGAAKSDFQQFSIGDQQTLRLLQRRRSMNISAKDLNCTDNSPTKERKLHMCLLCPYTNQRQDSLTNHYRRHGDTEPLNASSHKCSFCDLVVVQSHFLREHLKSHFQYYKTLTAECYVANKDVSFAITKLIDTDITNEREAVDVKLDVQPKTSKCSDEKTFVNMKTGELLVE